MRRLLAAIVTSALILVLALAVPALAASANRVPKGVTRISATVIYPIKTGPGAHATVRRTLTGAATVAEVVKATNALPIAHVVGACPMLMVLGPRLTVVYRNSKGTELAQAEVQVTSGNRGDSGSSVCSPIRFLSGSHSASLIGNSWVRMMGKLIGADIS